MKYPKILTLFKRDKKFKVRVGDYTIPEFEMIYEWEVTEKIHGMNIRVIYQKGEYSVPFVMYLGRGDNSQIPKPLLEYLTETFTIEKLNGAFPELAVHGDHEFCITIFGEGYGASINSGGWYRKDKSHSFRAFDVYIEDNANPLGGWWLESENVKDICDKLDIEMVPIMGMIDTDTIVNAFISDDYAHRLGSIVQLYEDSQADSRVMEGFICKSKPLLFTRKGERLMFKLKVKDFARD